MVGGAGRNRVRLAARLDDGVERALPTVADPDVEAGRVEADVATHDPRQLDVADLVVDDVGPVDPGLLHRHRLEPEVGGDARHLAGVVRLHPTDRDQRVAALGERVGHEVLELAGLVAAERDPGVAVLPLGPDLHPAAEVGAEARQRMDGRRTERERIALEVVEISRLRHGTNRTMPHRYRAGRATTADPLGWNVTLRGAASIVGAYEHPLREIPDSTLAEIHADVALGALADAGLTLADVDAYFCDGEAPGLGPLSMAEYLGLRCRYADSTEFGGSSYLAHVGHAAAAIAAGKCDVALITLAGKPRTGGASPGGNRGVPRSARSRLRAVVGSDRPRPVRARRAASHVRVRHDQRPAGRDQGRRVAARAAQPERVPPRPGDGRSGARVADRRRPAPPARLLRRHRRRWSARRRPARDRTRSRARERQAARPRRGAEALRQRPHRRHRHRRGPIGPDRVRGGRCHAGRRRLRVDLRQLHDHRARDDRGSGLLRQGRGRTVRRPTARWCRPAGGCRSTPTVAGCATTTPGTGAA